MRNPKNRTHIDVSRQGSVIIRYITITGNRVVRRIVMHGAIGSLLDINSYISNKKIHELTSYASSYIPVLYIFDHLNTRLIKFSANPTHLNIFIKPISLKKESNVIGNTVTPLMRHKLHKRHKAVISLRYISDHCNLLRVVPVKNMVGRLFSIAPYITNKYIHNNISKSVSYDHVCPNYPKRFLNFTQVVNIYVSSTKHLPPFMGTIIIRFHYPEVKKQKTVVSHAKIGTKFYVQPYCDSLEINHNITVDSVNGLFKISHASKNIKAYSHKKQVVNIYAKEHSIEISISAPQTIIESLERYINYGSEPYFKRSEGPIDINRSSLIRYLMSAYGDEMTARSYMLVGKICRADPSHRYITLKTTNTHIIRRKGDRLSRLVCAMIKEKIPIMSFKHLPNGQIKKNAHGKPIVKQLYYPYIK